MSTIKIIKNKSRDLIAKKCLKEVIHMLPNTKKHQIKSSQILDYGKTPVISQEKEIISGYYNDLDPIHANSESPVIIFGDHSCTLKLVDFDFVLGGDGTKVFKSKNQEDTLFLYYCIKNIGLNTEGYKRHFSILKDKEILDISNKKNVCNILEKQESVISNIEKLISKTEKMFEYFCDKEFDLKDIEKNNYKIKDIIIKNPKSTIKAGDIKASTGNIPAFNSSAKLQYFYDDYLVDGENIFLPTGGSASIHYYNGKSCYTTDVFSFKTEEEKVINKYMYYYFKNDLSILNNMFYGAGLKHLNKNELLNYKISIPSLEKQKETVKLLEKQEILIENQKKLLEKEKQKFEWLSDKLLSGEYLVVEDE